VGENEGTVTVSGLSDGVFRNEASFPELDFEETWVIEEGDSYPYLRDNPQDPPPGLINIKPDDNILYVNHSATGNKSGNSWENAIPELADALRWAREQCGENGSGAAWDAEHPLQTWVAAGTYKPLYSAEDGKYRAAGEDARDNAFV